MSRLLAVAIAVVLPWIGAPQETPQVFRTRVDAVNVDVSVLSQNRPVGGLTARDFELADNGVPQAILDISRETSPIDVTLIVDMSGLGVLQSSLVAGVGRIRQDLHAGDRARIVTFQSHISEWAALADAAALPPFSMPAATLEGLAPNAPTSCYDAIALAIATPPPAGRRQVAILFSAGRDTSSFLDAPRVLEMARRMETAVFVVHARFDPEPREPPREGTTRVSIPVDPFQIPSSFFKDLVEATGGKLHVVEPVTMNRLDSKGFAMRIRMGRHGLESSFIRALDEFRSSYVLRYTPQGVAATGWHDLQVRVIKPGGRYEVRARKGYMR